MLKILSLVLVLFQNGNLKFGGKMPKTITIRLTDEDYNIISALAKEDRRTISNFLTYASLEWIKQQKNSKISGIATSQHGE